MDCEFCEIGLAIHKEAYTKYMLTGDIPALIKHLPGKPYEDALYWHFKDIEWSSAQKDLEDFFNRLNQESEVSIYVNQPGQVKVPLYSKGCFGALRMGDESEDFQSWGCPEDYGLKFIREIVLPGEP